MGFDSLPVGQDSDPAQRSSLGVIPDRTGVDEDDVGFSTSFCEVVTLCCQDTRNDFGVVLVHLTAVGFDKDRRRSVFRISFFHFTSNLVDNWFKCKLFLYSFFLFFT